MIVELINKIFFGGYAEICFFGGISGVGILYGIEC